MLIERDMTYDAIVIGSGPNGLAAAIELSRAGYAVRVYEKSDVIGGGARSARLTLPGFVHDVCSAVQPLAVASPFFATLPLVDYGLEFVTPPVPLAHPFDDGTAVLLHRSIEATALGLHDDAVAYEKLMRPLVANWPQLSEDLLGPPRIPRHPFKLGRFALRGIRSAKTLAQHRFKNERTRALFAGLASHSFLPLDQPLTSAFALVLGILAHVTGWPITRGGSQNLSAALANYLTEIGGEIVTSHEVRSLDDLPTNRLVMCDMTPRQLLQLAEAKFPSRYRKKLRRYRYGPGAFKMDWALKNPVPWSARECHQAATVHLGGSFEEILASESDPWLGRHCERPFTIVCQPSLFDQTRTPTNQHTLWAYCHVPNGSTVDMSERIEKQIERFAPGFRSEILARNIMSPKELEQHNPNLVGGDINGGAQDLRQCFMRPTISTYSTPIKGLFICSSSTPPGGGVHGMCGYHAARTALSKF
jgi:phytoene dehydrogenase-like protein